MSGAVLQGEDVHIRIGGRPVVQAANLALRGGELVALVGPNGAGKTSLVRALAGLLPCEGRVLLEGRPLAAWPLRERARRMAYLPQGNIFHWPLPVATAVALGRLPHGDPFARPNDVDRAAVRRALEITGTAVFAERAVTSLSGGERARVALARALATGAGVLLADEPTVSLDPRHQLVVMEVLRAASRQGAAVLAVVHDLTLAARFADRIVAMQDGRIVADGPPRDTLSVPTLARVFGIEVAMVDAGDGTVPIARRPVDP